MEAILAYLFLGFVFALMNIDYSERLFKNSTYEQYRTEKMANGIRNIVLFNNIKTIFYRISVGCSYVLFFPLMFLIKIIDKTNYKNIIKFIPPISITMLIFHYLGELTAYSSRVRTDKAGFKFQTLYTLNGKMKHYKNGKLHNDRKAWAIEEDSHIASAIRNVPFYYKNGESQKFNFNHEERYFLNGKEVSKMLHSECMRILFGQKINDF